jgi:prepilin-type N-terminal cleavage/methylation domain-containing protein
MGFMSVKVSCGFNQSARRRGFSLLELLVALTILAIALIPVAYFYSKSLQMVEQASIRTRALMLAQERLTEIQQMPYEMIRSNVTPSEQELKIYSNYGPIDTTAADWYGYDFETIGEWAAMFNYPLPLDYNPYRPQSQGYNNATGVQHFLNNNPITGEVDPHVNFNGGGAEIDYEYEPIGFMTQKVFNHDRALSPFEVSDVRMMDQRSIPGLEPSLDNGYDYFRTGNRDQLDKYEIYGRRTIIMDVLPTPRDLDGGNISNTSPVVGADGYAPDSDFDGNASAVNPYPVTKGPDNKFQMSSRNGTRGKMVIVQVFWLPRDAPGTYIQGDDLNKVELRTFIPASNEDSSLARNEGGITRNDYLVITPTE